MTKIEGKRKINKTRVLFFNFISSICKITLSSLSFLYVFPQYPNRALESNETCRPTHPANVVIDQFSVLLPCVLGSILAEKSCTFARAKPTSPNCIIYNDRPSKYSIMQVFLKIQSLLLYMFL